MIEARDVRVLLIEDDPDDFLLTSDVADDVSGLNIDLVWVEDPRDGVERAVGEAFDVILLDFRLGDMTGLDVMERLRASKIQTPTVVLTGQNDVTTGRRVVREGADEYLFKEELSPATLHRAIAHAIERRSYIERIEQREALHRAVLASLHEGVIAFDAAGVVTHANERSAQLLERARRHLIGSSNPFGGWRVTDSDAREMSRDTYPWTQVAREQRTSAERVIGLWDGLTLRRWLSVKVQPWVRSNGRVEGAVASLADVTEEHQTRQTLHFKAFHDPLTRLPNRELFHDRLEQALTLMDRAGRSGIAVLFLDLDRFKAINDTWGHAAGDQVLKAVAERIDGELRGHDTLARISGDEFVVLLRDIESKPQAVTVVERICSVLAQPVGVGDASIVPSISVGIALHLHGSTTAGALLKRADAALYDAKRAGRNTYRFAPTSAPVAP